MTKRLSPRELTLTRLPRPATPDEYVQASAEIEDRLRELPGVVAVYRTGAVSVPGISDLDRIAVVEKGGRVPPVWPSLSQRTRDLAMHGPFLIDHATFRRHRWFAYVEPLELAFGEAVELEDRPLPAYSEPLIGAESLTISLLSMVKQLSTRVFKVRPSLCQLNNLRHALALARLDADDAPAAWRLAGDVTKLRNDWFGPTPDRTELVKDVATRSVPALLEALGALGRQDGLVDGTAREARLGAPWRNVVLTATESDGDPVSVGRQVRLPFIRSAAAAELSWRTARPKIALRPAVIALLTGGGHENEFRSARDELVRRYRHFLAEDGRGYAEIGLASPFLPKTSAGEA